MAVSTLFNVPLTFLWIFHSGEMEPKIFSMKAEDVEAQAHSGSSLIYMQCHSPLCVAE
jgi:hypothetical protein